MNRRLASSAPVLLLLSACGMDFDAASFVERPRLVGAQTVVAGAPGRATPLPGDAVTLEPWLLQPEEPSPVRASTVICAATDVRRGAAGCRGMPLAVVPPTAPSETLAPIPFVVPPLEALGGASQLLVIVASCDRGATPSLDASTFLPSCDDPMARAELTTLNVPLAFEAALANQHPSLADEDYTVSDRAWAAPPAELAARGCASEADSDALPRLVVPRDAAPPDADEPFTVTLTFTASEDDRETYGPAASPLRENLQISHYVTHGAMERSFSAFDALTATGEPLDIDWTPPAVAEIPAEGVVVRFTWIARDLRGGFARADRALCLVAGS